MSRWMSVGQRFGWSLMVVAMMGLARCGKAKAQECASAHIDEAVQKPVQLMVDARAAERKGKTALYAVQLNTGKSVAVDADVPVQTASVIKLAILYEAMVQVRAGKARWDEKITLHPGEAVPGSGMLLFFDTPLTVTLKDVLTFMVIVSDNTATNLMIDRFGIDAVNARVESLGLKNTHLYKKVFKPATGPMPADQPKFGLGKTTPREIATLMTLIGECRLQTGVADGKPMFHTTDDEDRAVCGVTLKMLKSQFYRETVPRYIEGVDSTTGGVAIASKTGSLDAVRNDVAIVEGRLSKDEGGPMVLAIFTYENADHGWTVDNEGEVEIAKLAKTIVNAWSPAGLDGKMLVPGLGLVASGCAANEPKM
jgi:beta-lactamase class A